MSKDNEIEIVQPLWGMSVAGWVTKTVTTDGDIYYGMFHAQKEALDWATKLENAIVEPVYKPAFNRG